MMTDESGSPGNPGDDREATLVCTKCGEFHKADEETGFCSKCGGRLQPTEGISRKRVLVVEDTEVSRRKIVAILRKLGCEVTFEDHLAKVSVVGMGMRMHTGVAERMFAALAEGRINIQNITTSEIKISCVIDRSQARKALRVVHDAFDLGGRSRGKKKTKKAKKAKKK